MGQVTSLFVWKVVGEVDASADRAALLRSVGIDPDGPIDPSRMVPDSEYYDFFERCAAADPEGWTLPLRVGAAMRCDEYGAFGLAWKAATDLRGSYRRAERYARVLTSVSTYEVEPTEGGAFMHLHREGERRIGMRLSNEATIASIDSISRQASAGEFQPLAVYFKHPAPGSAAEHEGHFGCPVHFGSERDALLVSEATLRTPNRVGDADIVRFFDTLLDADLSKLDDDPSLERRVLDRISRSLSEEVPAVSEVARHLAMSGRTLQRRLAEIAFMTGFAEQSFVGVPHDAFVAGVRDSGAPEEVVWMMDYLFATVLDGRNSHLTDGVQRALGRPPKDFATFAREVAATGLWSATA